MRERVKPRSRREIPAVNKVLDALGEHPLPRPLIVDLVRREQQWPLPVDRQLEHREDARVLREEPLDVAAEIQISRFEELKCLFSCVVSFDIFLADGKESNRRSLDTEYLFSKHRSHDAELKQILGRRIDISSSVT